MSSSDATSGYRRMLKATSAIAGAKVVTIVISVIRSKVLAMLLGPAGMGVIGLVTSSVEFARVIFGVGLDGATVRKIVDASSKDDPDELERTYRAAARMAVVIGLVAWLGVSLASPWLSQGAFSTPSKFWLFIVGGASLVFTPLLGVQLAFLQGLRLVKLLAICQILVALLGAAATLAAVGIFGEYGGVCVLAPVSISSLLIHRHYVSRHRPASGRVLAVNYREEFLSNLKFGSGFAVNAIWLTASTWLNVLLIRHYYADQGTFFVGLYGAASTLSNLYVGVVLSALSTEFYPALSALADKPVEMKALLNQQTVLAIAIGVPCSLAALILAPYLLQLLYSSDFAGGTSLLRCLLAGMAIRFATCPLGFVMLARRATRAVLASELLVGTLMIASCQFFLRQQGLIGLGIALVLTNIFHLLWLIFLTRKMGVHFSRRILFLITETFLVLGLCLWLTLRFAGLQGMASAGVIFLLYGSHMLIVVSRDSGVTLAGLLRRIHGRARI